MSAAFIVSNPDGWLYSVRADDDNSECIRIEQIDDGSGTPTGHLVFTKEEAMFIATALQRLAINKD
jgi:hypothetical protein